MQSDAPVVRVIEAEWQGPMVVGVGLGSNLGDRDAIFRSAVTRLSAFGTIAAVSPIYETEAIGPEQPRYLNAALRMRVEGSPVWVLDRLHEVEAEHGRERLERWGPRTLDLDLLVALDAHDPVDPASDEMGAEPEALTLLHVLTERLTVPHPELLHRSFALAPLLDVFPELRPFWDAKLVSLGGPPALHTLQMVVV